MAASRTPFHERIKGQWHGLAEDPVQAQSLATELASRRSRAGRQTGAPGSTHLPPK